MHDALASIDEIAERARDVGHERDAIALDQSQQGDIVRRLEQATSKKIRATFAVDARLIGGAKVQIGDRLIDASLRTQLDHLARQLAS